MSVNGIEAGKAFVKFLLDDKELNKGLAKAGAKLQSFGKKGMAVSAPIVAGFAACTAAFVEAGSKLDDLSQRSGISGEALSELAHAAQMSGTDIDTLASGVAKMQKNIAAAASGTGTFGKQLATMGVRIEDLQGLNPEQQFTMIADAISKIEDPTMRAAAAQRAFGGAGRELLPLLNAGALGIQAMREQAKALGITMSQETVDAADKLGDALDIAKVQVYQMGVQVGAAVSGPLLEFLERMHGVSAVVIDFIKAHPDMVVAIGAISTAFFGASAAAYAVGSMMTVLSVHPVLRTIIVLTTAVVALNEAMKGLTDWVNSDDNAWAEAKLAEIEAIEKELDEVGRKLGLEPSAASPPAINPDALAANALAMQARADAAMGTIQSQMAIPVPSTGHFANSVTVEGFDKLLDIEERMLAAILRLRSGMITGPS